MKANDCKLYYKLVNKIKLYHPPDRTCPDRTRPNGATST